MTVKITFRELQRLSSAELTRRIAEADSLTVRVGGKDKYSLYLIDSQFHLQKSPGEDDAKSEGDLPVVPGRYAD